MNQSIPALSLEGVHIRFGARPGLSSLSLSVRAGERVAVVGPSGVGKTSLLRAIAGLQAIDDGRLHVDGREVRALAPEQRGVVYLHQSPSLFPHLSVLDNVGFPLEVRGRPRAAARLHAMPLLARVQMEAFAARAPSTLSGGQRHRVALARALAADPAVLLLDEPFASLDPSLRDDVRTAVLSLLDAEPGDERGDEGGDERGDEGGDERPRRQPAVLLVTHDIDEAALMADRIVVLLGGRIVQDDVPAVVLSSPKSLAVARFLGVPNAVRGSCAGGVFRCAVGVRACALPDGVAWLVSRADGFVARRMSDPVANASADSIAGVVIALEQRVSGACVRVQVAGDGSEGAVVVARADAQAHIAQGDRVALCMDAGRVHIVAESAGDV